MQDVSRKQGENSTMISHALWMLLLLICTRDSIASTEKIADTGNTLEDVQRELKYDGIESIALFPRELTLLQQAIDTIDDDTCRDQCQSVLNGVRNLTGWAIKFYDASGKFPSLLVGSVYQLSNFDECIDLDDETPAGSHGQYCLGEADVEVPEIYLCKNGSVWQAFRNVKERYREPTRKLYWGVCVPAGCTVENIQDVIR